MSGVGFGAATANGASSGGAAAANAPKSAPAAPDMDHEAFSAAAQQRRLRLTFSHQTNNYTNEGRYHHRGRHFTLFHCDEEQQQRRMMPSPLFEIVPPHAEGESCSMPLPPMEQQQHRGVVEQVHPPPRNAIREQHGYLQVPISAPRRRHSWICG